MNCLIKIKSVAVTDGNRERDRLIDSIGLIERLRMGPLFGRVFVAATFLRGLYPPQIFKRPGDHRLPRPITATGHLPKGVSICSATFISQLLGLNIHSWNNACFLYISDL